MASETTKRSVEGGAAEIAGKGQDAADAASAGAADVANRAQASLKSTSDAAGTLYDKAADHVRDIAERAPASLSDAAAMGQRLAQDGHHRLHGGVRSQPVEALLLAGAIGYLVGWAASRG